MELYQANRASADRDPSLGDAVWTRLGMDAQRLAALDERSFLSELQGVSAIVWALSNKWARDIFTR